MVLTMGLTNLPGFFQHRMEFILAKYLWFFVLVYIDDIIIFSRSKKEHLYYLDRILQLLEDLGVTLSIAKCHFGYPSIKVLEHHVSWLGLSIVEEKTKAIWNLDYSEYLRDLETELGFFRYYRKFIPYYSAIA